MNPKLNSYFSKARQWQEELTQLRRIILDCGLTEELKWGNPCYTFQDGNVILLGSFKEYCVISFLKGALLNDADGILQKPGENTQSARVVRFTDVSEITAIEADLKAYIFEAIEVEKAGLKVDFKTNDELEFPEEFQTILDKNSALKTAFAALTPGRQRAYNMYFSSAKQSKTRTSRVEKYTQQILDGKGISDCTCGFSKKLPYCDGSHKYI
ncbi:DUF1801 domain-containing protein [Persicitalea sp.]|uniref:DUF1801 domain-containing protein n=1 Tax=Persicitalea sp. TaxID=3100273 RepID=UPI0035944A50